jgi:hypothetical protein
MQTSSCLRPTSSDEHSPSALSTPQIVKHSTNLSAICSSSKSCQHQLRIELLFTSIELQKRPLSINSIQPNYHEFPLKPSWHATLSCLRNRISPSPSVPRTLASERATHHRLPHPQHAQHHATPSASSRPLSSAQRLYVFACGSMTCRLFPDSRSRPRPCSRSRFRFRPDPDPRLLK